VEPESSAWLLFERNLQSFAPPDALHPIFAHIPAGLLQQGCNAPIPVAAILTGQGQDRLCQPIFVIALGGLIALGSPRLAHQPACAPFTQSLFPSVLNGDATPLGT